MLKTFLALLSTQRGQLLEALQSHSLAQPVLDQCREDFERGYSIALQQAPSAMAPLLREMHRAHAAVLDRARDFANRLEQLRDHGTAG